MCCQHVDFMSLLDLSLLNNTLLRQMKQYPSEANEGHSLCPLHLSTKNSSQKCKSTATSSNPLFLKTFAFHELKPSEQSRGTLEPHEHLKIKAAADKHCSPSSRGVYMDASCLLLRANKCSRREQKVIVASSRLAPQLTIKQGCIQSAFRGCSRH
eukprot:1159284-Pelagomonas_calceolata.AAC.12